MKPTTILKAALLIDGTGSAPIADPLVVIEGEKIAGVFQGALPPSFRVENPSVIDLPRATLLPGLVDCHVHSTLRGDGTPAEGVASVTEADVNRIAQRNLQRALEAGITTLRDCGGPCWATLEARRRVTAGAVRGPRIAACGHPLTTIHGHTWYFGGEYNGAAELRRAVCELAARGVDFIKVMGSGGGTVGTRPWQAAFSQDELQVVVRSAHGLGLKVAVHSLNAETTRRALSVGADHVEHAGFFRDPSGFEEFEPRVAEALADSRTAVTLTLSTRYHTVMALRRFGQRTPEELAELRQRQGKLDVALEFGALLYRAGVHIVAGTDAGWRHTPFDAIVDEISLLRQIGMSPVEAIASATGRGAEAIGLGRKIGVVHYGYIADLVAVSGSPLQNTESLRRPIMVMQSGRVVMCGMNESYHHERQEHAIV